MDFEKSPSYSSICSTQYVDPYGSKGGHGGGVGNNLLYQNTANGYNAYNYGAPAGQYHQDHGHSHQDGHGHSHDNHAYVR